MAFRQSSPSVQPHYPSSASQNQANQAAAARPQRQSGQPIFTQQRFPASTGNSPMKQGVNGFIPNGPSGFAHRMQNVPTNLNQPLKPSPRTETVQMQNAPPNLQNRSGSYTPTNAGDQHLRGSPGLNGTNSPLGRMTPTRPVFNEQKVSSITPTQVSNNMPLSRQQPNAAMSHQPLNINSRQQQPLNPTQPTFTEAAGIPGGKRRAYPSQATPGMASVNSTSNPQENYHAQLVQSPGGIQQSQQQTQQPNYQTTQRMPNQNTYRPSSQPNVQETNQLMGRLTVEQSATYPINLMEQKQIVPPKPLPPPKPPMSQDQLRRNAKPEVLRCTLNAVPQTSSLLKQCKLPFGIYIHPFKDEQNSPIVSSVITRCRSCRSYLNPFVSILDQRRWQCNICFRVNDLPEELSYDYASRQYIDIRKRPELSSASVEFIAPSEYMLRPPQASVFIFVLDVSFTAISTGYLHHCCEQISQNIDQLPGDSRMMISFITFNSSVHFYSIKASQSQPQMFVMSDLEDVYLPVPDGLLVNIKENKDMILQLLESLPTSFNNDHDTNTCTGAAMTVARKMASSSGGRITVFQTCLPSVGPGKLLHRETSNMTANSKDVQNLNASTDFYKKLALECAGEQIAVDIFLLSGQYCDLASLSCVSRYSSGAIHYYPEFHATKNPGMLQKFCADFKRYLTRSIGFEAVMRLRCTKGLSIHTFHGNFFVRSTDLLSLPNVNPDHSFGMQISIEDSLTDCSTVGFQAALLYTTTKGERRIRVHTLCLPVTSKLSDVYAYADEEAIVVSLAKLAVDRTLMSSLGDAREALMNACIDCLKVYRSEVAGQKNNSSLILPNHLRMLPLHILALMKNEAFKLGSGVSLDARVFSLLEFKWQPWQDLMLKVYPRLYSLLDLIEEKNEESSAANEPLILQASAEKLSRQGIYLMDAGKILYLFVGRNVSQHVIRDLFHVENFSALPEKMDRLPEVDSNKLNVETRKFIEKLRKDRPFYAVLEVIREDTRNRLLFLNNLIDDKTESSMSYHEFLQHLQRQLNG